MKLFWRVLSLSLTTTILQAQGTAVVSGVVRDEVGAPVRDVLVVIDPESLSLRTRTGADGRIASPSLPADMKCGWCALVTGHNRTRSRSPHLRLNWTSSFKPLPLGSMKSLFGHPGPACMDSLSRAASP